MVNNEEREGERESGRGGEERGDRVSGGVNGWDNLFK